MCVDGNYRSALNASVLLVDEEPERDGVFSIMGFANGGPEPLNITLVEGAPYHAVHIQANGEDADARVTLNGAFEGSFVVRALEPSGDRETDVYVEGDFWDTAEGSPPPGAECERKLAITDHERYEIAGEVASSRASVSAEDEVEVEDWSGKSYVAVSSVRGSAYITL